jgi:hypothetical protein
LIVLIINFGANYRKKETQEHIYLNSTYNGAGVRSQTPADAPPLADFIRISLVVNFINDFYLHCIIFLMVPG